MSRRKYRGRITDGWPRDMWPEIKKMAAQDKCDHITYPHPHKPAWVCEKCGKELPADYQSSNNGK